MTRAYLLEDFSTHHKLDPQSIVIALRPEVAHRLDKQKIPYKLMEDYYDEEKLRVWGRKVLPEFQNFCQQMDQILQPLLGSDFFKTVSLTKIFYSRLRYLIQDVMIRAWILESFIQKVQPSEIHFVPRALPKEEHSSMFEFQDQTRDSFRLLLEKIETKVITRDCARPSSFWRKASGDVCLPARQETILKAPRLPRSLQSLVMTVKQIGKNVRNCHIYEKQERFHGVKQASNALFLDAGTFEIDFVIRKAVKELDSVFLYSEGAIWQLDSLLEKKVWSAPAAATADSKFHEAFMALSSNHELWTCFEAPSKMNWREILLPYFEHWLTDFLPDAMQQAESLREFYDAFSIDHLIARAGANNHHMAPFIAASAADSNPRKVCFQHGMGPYMNDYLYELDLFDRYFASDELCSNYFQGERGSRAQVFQSPHYLQKVSRLGGDRKTKNKVIFLPRHLSNGFRHFQAMGYPFVWYYKLQKALVDLFAKRDDCQFVYKYSKGQPWIEQTLLRDIQAMNLSHLKAESDHFWSYIPEAGRVIQDYPSSPTYESAAAGVPVLSLFFKGEPLVTEAMKVFGKSLQPFSKISEAVTAVDNFLSEDPQVYRVPFPELENECSDSFFSLEIHEQKA